ncbi:AAA family ATPase, partial [Haliangium sp. UPWRP_2]|uniref:AAA family ATPase n=1 Tax=Haliangium sp. UPWRP_2 TaxID=1931276 RepID=UPI0011B20357
MIRKLFASNFRSLGEGVEIPLGQVNVLVGQNAAGKSSIIDLIRFLRDAVHQNAEQALSTRGGLPSIKRRGSAPDAAVRVGAEFNRSSVETSWEFSLMPEG